MSVYAKRLNGAQRRLLNQYEGLTGFEPMHQEDLDAGRMTFAEMWRANVNWFDGVHADVMNLHESGAGQYGDRS